MPQLEAPVQKQKDCKKGRVPLERGPLFEKKTRGLPLREQHCTGGGILILASSASLNTSTKRIAAEKVTASFGIREANWGPQKSCPLPHHNSMKNKVPCNNSKRRWCLLIVSCDGPVTSACQVQCLSRLPTCGTVAGTTKRTESRRIDSQASKKTESQRTDSQASKRTESQRIDSQASKRTESRRTDSQASCSSTTLEHM